MVGLPLAEAFKRLLPGMEAETLAKLKESYQKAFGSMRRRGEVRDPLFPGALEGLTIMEDTGWLLGMATGKSHRGLVATLNGHGLGERFVTLQTADRCRGKPHPEMLLNAISEADAKPSSTVMIGDTTYDMEMAQNAGTLAVGVSWGYHGVAELKEAGADAVIDAFGELPGTAETLLKEK
jgi:phosphoglycolate phosphatase